MQKTPGIIQYLGYDTLTAEELDNFSKNVEGKLLITAWGDTFDKLPSQGVRRALLLTKLFCEAKKKGAFTLDQVPKEILEEFNASEKKKTRAAAEKIAGALKISVAKRLKEGKRKDKAQEEEKKRKAEQQQKEDDEQALAGVDRPRSKQIKKK